MSKKKNTIPDGGSEAVMEERRSEDQDAALEEAFVEGTLPEEDRREEIALAEVLTEESLPDPSTNNDEFDNDEDVEGLVLGNEADDFSAESEVPAVDIASGPVEPAHVPSKPGTSSVIIEADEYIDDIRYKRTPMGLFRYSDN